MTRQPIEIWQLRQRQGLPLDIKIKMSKRRIREFYNVFESKVYISYSGGKDSEVMMHLVKECYPRVKVVFVDTGTELDTRKHAIGKADVVLKPKIPMIEVWKKYGIPFPSKQQAKLIEVVRNTKNKKIKDKYLNGTQEDGTDSLFRIAKKWKPLIESEIRVSDRCCFYLKKEPFGRYKKQTGEVPFIGTMAEDSEQRKTHYLQSGCINFKKEVCHPLGFWTEQDVLMYITRFNLDYCKAYGDIVKVGNLLKTTKAKRTGCVGCGFGVHLEKEPNRFQRMEKENPRLHNIVLHKWCDGAMGKILDLYKINYNKPKYVQALLEQHIELK